MVSSESFPGKEEMEQSLQKLEKDLKETCSERDKALQELTRLKQHLIEKVISSSCVYKIIYVIFEYISASIFVMLQSRVLPHDHMLILL